MNAFTRKTIILSLVIPGLSLVGWFGLKAGHKVVEHHLIARAGRCLNERDYQTASLCLRRVLESNPANVEASRLMADLLDDAGNPAAINWRIFTARIQTNNVEDRFAWARTSIKFNDVPGAIRALRGMDDKSKSTAQYHKLVGALAWTAHDQQDAEKEYSRALELEPTNLAVVLNLATVRLLSTNRASADQGRSTLERFPRGSPLHLAALRTLATDSAKHKSFDTAIACCQEIIEDPQATFTDKMACLDIFRISRSPRFEAWEATMESDAAGAPDRAFTMAHWKQAAQSPTVALNWLQSLPAQVRTNQPVPVCIADCQIAMADWSGLVATVERQDWRDLNYYRLLLESLARRNLGQTFASEAAWQQAFQLCFQHLEKLETLNNFTTACQWTPERYKVLQKIVLEFPAETWADEQLATLLYKDGKTQALADLLGAKYSDDPTNIALKHNLATVLLLLKSDTAKAYRLASESYHAATNNPSCACTYAYSLLLQSRPRDAVKILNSVGADSLKNPSIAAFYGVIEAAAGCKEAAKGPLEFASRAHLLPEEMELVRQVEDRP